MSTLKWKPYPEYRVIPHAGIEKIPNHWDSKRMKYVFSERGEVSEDGTEELLSVSKYTGVKVRSTTTDREARAASLVGYKKCEPNDIVSNIMLAWDSALGVAFDSGIVSSAYEVYVPQQEIDPHFLDLLLRTPEYRVAFTIVSKGIVPSRWRMYTESFNDIQMILPPLNEQKQIGSFVHRINENISKNIQHLETQISLLEEKRSALITYVVTKGLNPDAPMKDSGIQWIGKIPDKWTIKRMKHLSPKINVGLVINPSIYVRENGVPFLYGGNIIPRGFSLVNVRYMSEEDSIMLHQSRLLEGDLVTVRVGEPGITAVIPSHMEGANCASVIITRSCKSFDSHWLCNVMNSPVVSTQIDLVKYGSAQKQFNIAHAIEFTVPVPPLEEQKQISEFIHSKNRLIDKMKTSISEKINHLNEYRTALISAAVTGKIDLRGL